MKHVPELITTTFVLGSNVVLSLFDRTPLPNNESRRRELESLNGLYGDDLLQTIDVYSNDSYRVINKGIEKLCQDIHHEVPTVHKSLRNRLQAVSSAVENFKERVHSHSIAALKLQKSVEESYVEYDSLVELKEKILGLSAKVRQKETTFDLNWSTIEKDFNKLLDNITQISSDWQHVSKQKCSAFTNTENTCVLDRIEYVYQQKKLAYLKSLFKIRKEDKCLVDMRLDLEERKSRSRPYSNWTAETLEEQQVQLKPKLVDLRFQLKKLKDKYIEADRRSGMYHLEQESLEKEFSRYHTTLTNTKQELQLKRDEVTLANKQKALSGIVAKLSQYNKEIDNSLKIIIKRLAIIVVDMYCTNRQSEEQGLTDYLLSDFIGIEDLPRLQKALDLLQKFEALRLRNQQHILRMDVWLDKRKIEALEKRLKEHKQLGADKNSFSSAMKEIEQDIEKRRGKVGEGLQQIFQTHLEILLERHKQLKACLKTSQYAFELACSSREVDFQEFKNAMWNTKVIAQFEQEETIEDETRRKVIESCIQTKLSVIFAAKVLKAKHAEVLLVASQTPNLMHSHDLVKRQQKIHKCQKQLRLIETEVKHLLN